MFTPATIILIGGLFTLILTYIAALVQEKDSKNDKQDLIDNNDKMKKELFQKNEEHAKIQRDSDEEIKELQRKLVSEYKDQADKSAEIASLYKKLAESQEEVTALTKETKFHLTGGNSYCFLDIRTSKQTDKAYLYLVHRGNYTLQNIEIKLFNTDFSCGNYNSKKGDDLQSSKVDSSKSFIVENLKAETFKPLGEIETPIKAQKSFEVRFRSNNGEWYQRIMLRVVKHGADHIMATHIYKVVNGKKITIKEGTSDNLNLLFVEVEGFEDTTINSDDECFGEGVKKGIWKGFPLMKGELSPWTNRCKVIWDRGLFITTSEKGI